MITDSDENAFINLADREETLEIRMMRLSLTLK